MITLHHLEYSQSFRVPWLLEELGIEYTLKRYDRDPETLLAPEDYKALSPLGTAPVLEDGALVLAETGAILDHLLDSHPGHTLRPVAGHADRDRHLFWAHAAQGSLMPLMLVDTLLRIFVSRSPFFLKPLMRGIQSQAVSAFAAPRTNTLLDVAEAHLAEAPWFGGDALTTADVLMSYPMESAIARGYIEPTRNRCHDWYARMTARPAFQRAKEKDGRPSMVLPL